MRERNCLPVLPRTRAGKCSKAANVGSTAPHRVVGCCERGVWGRGCAGRAGCGVGVAVVQRNKLRSVSVSQSGRNSTRTRQHLMHNIGARTAASSTDAGAGTPQAITHTYRRHSRLRLGKRACGCALTLAAKQCEAHGCPFDAGVFATAASRHNESGAFAPLSRQQAAQTDKAVSLRSQYKPPLTQHSSVGRRLATGCGRFVRT